MGNDVHHTELRRAAVGKCTRATDASSGMRWARTQDYPRESQVQAQTRLESVRAPREKPADPD